MTNRNVSLSVEGAKIVHWSVSSKFPVSLGHHMFFPFLSLENVLLHSFSPEMSKVSLVLSE